MTPERARDEFTFAPLRGVTVRSFRNLHARWFFPPDRAMAPFIPTVAGSRIKPLLLKDIDPELGQAVPLVPQVIGKDPESLRILLRAFKSMGYTCADLNAGCPYPFIVKKGRGAGLLRDAANFSRMLEVGCEEMPQGFSVKVRLGIETPDLLLARMAQINRFPLREVTIHGRTARQMYTGTVCLEAFAEAAAACAHAVVYNGDIRTRRDYIRLKQRFPAVTRWMIGRGAVTDLFLFQALCATEPPTRAPARLYGFLDAYLALCEAELFGPAAVLGRLKELWSYLHLGLQQGERIWRAVRICRRVSEYRLVVEEVFRVFPGFTSV